MTPAVTLCWGTVGASTLAELAVAADAGGFDAISAMPAMALALDGRRPPMAVSYVDALLGALPGSRPMADVPEGYQHFFEPGVDGCFRALEHAECTVLNVAHFLGVAAPIEAMVDTFGALCARAAEHGAELTLEFIPGSGIPDLATALDIVTRTAAPNAGVLVDTWHLSRSGGTVADLDAAPPGVLRALQISDRDTRAQEGAYVPMSDRALPGDGDLPLTAIVDAVRRNHPAALLSVEVFNTALAAAPLPDAGARAGAATRRLLETLA